MMLHSILTRFILWLAVFLCCAVYCQADEGDAIVFIAETQQSWQVFQINRNGTELHQMPNSPCDALNVSRVPGKQKILLTCTNRKAYFFDLKKIESAEIQTRLNQALDAVLSRDSLSFLFSLSTGGSNDANHIWLTDIATKKTTQLTHMKGMQHNPIWSHDDKYIFFLSGEGKQDEDIWRLDVESGSLSQLTAGQLYNFEPSCSINDEIAFSSNRSGNYEIWAMDPYGGNVRQLTHNPAFDSQPSWSPDGESLVFVSNRDGQPALYIMDRKGQTTRRLSPEGMICRNPVWGR